MMARPRHRETGFTLTELMVVVSIIGILVTMAVVYMRPRTRPIDVATRVGDLLREGSRRAVALGPVRSDCVAVYGRARTQVTATVISQNFQNAAVSSATFTLQRLQEGATGVATWIAIESYTVDFKVQPVGWAVGVGSTVLPGAANTDFSSFVAQCKPDGTCDPRTVFFRAREIVPDAEQLSRLSIMPLGGAITARTDWN